LFGSASHNNILRFNDFTDIASYFLQKVRCGKSPCGDFDSEEGEEVGWLLKENFIEKKVKSLLNLRQDLYIRTHCAQWLDILILF